MKTSNRSKSKRAELLNTSRSQMDRLLDLRNDGTLVSLQRAAAMLGRRIHVELVKEGAPEARMAGGPVRVRSARSFGFGPVASEKARSGHHQ